MDLGSIDSLGASSRDLAWRMRCALVSVSLRVCLQADDDVVYQKEPRFSRQVVAEFTFEQASETPYVLLPFIFEPGREALFKLSILSDDRDDDGEPDFGFQAREEGVGRSVRWGRVRLRSGEVGRGGEGMGWSGKGGLLRGEKTGEQRAKSG